MRTTGSGIQAAAKDEQRISNGFRIEPTAGESTEQLVVRVLVGRDAAQTAGHPVSAGEHNRAVHGLDGPS